MPDIFDESAEKYQRASKENRFSLAKPMKMAVCFLREGITMLKWTAFILMSVSLLGLIMTAVKVIHRLIPVFYVFFV